ncbi:tripartite tricarboxylate transporter substrate-binding protein [Cupriavidus basilensis]
MALACLTVAGLWQGVVPAARAAGADAASSCSALRIVVPFPAAGPADLLARTLAQGLHQRRGVTVVVDNKPGANGNIGIDAVRRAAGDGCTLLVAPAGNLTINPTLFPALAYNVEQDFRPVSLLASSPNVLAVHPSVRAGSVQELVALAKRANPPLGYASPGVGSGLHLAGELFRQQTGIALLHVPYKGTTQALNDVVGGQVPILFGTLPTLAPFIRSGALRALAVTQARALSAAPAIPVPGGAGRAWPRGQLLVCAAAAARHPGASGRCAPCRPCARSSAARRSVKNSRGKAWSRSPARPTRSPRAFARKARAGPS